MKAGGFMKLLLLLLTLCSLSFSTDTLRITVGLLTGSEVYRECERYVGDLNRALNGVLYLKLEYQPYERSAVSLKESKTDGDFLRSTYVYNNDDPVIRLEIPIAAPVKYYLFARPAFFDTISYFPDTSCRYIAFLNNRATTQWLKKQNLRYHEMKDFGLMVQMVQLERACCIVSGEAFQNEPEVQKAGLIMSQKPIFEDHLYFYLHKNNAHHRSALEAAIKTVKNDSTITPLFKKSIQGD